MPPAPGRTSLPAHIRPLTRRYARPMKSGRHPTLPHSIHTPTRLPHKISTRVTHPTPLSPSSCGVTQPTTTTCCGFWLDEAWRAYYSARPENTAHCEAPDRVEGLPAKSREGHDEGTGTPAVCHSIGR